MMIAFSGMMKIVIELQKVGLVVTRCKTIPNEDVARRLLVTAMCVTKQSDWRKVFISKERITDDYMLLIEL